jgi:uncharacterized membrane protein YraQ (UPF0718 family)
VALILLVISLLAFAVGPALYGVAGRARGRLGALDGFVMVTVAGLALVHIIPHAVLAAGPAALAVSLIGFVGPGLVEHRLERAAHQTHNAALALALFGLMVHELFDGVGLAQAFYDPDSGTSVLAVAVVLHRLPIAITVWWLLRPVRGPLLAWAVLAALGAATVLGYVSGDAIAGAVDPEWLGMLEALIAGSLLHVVVHRPSPLSAPDQGRRERLWGAAGALLGLVAVLALAGDHHAPHDHDAVPGAVDVRDVFVVLAARTAPFLLIGFGLAGAMLAIRRRRADPAPATPDGDGDGDALEPPIWVGSRASRRLHQALGTRERLSAGALGLLIASPQLGVDAFLVSVPLLGPSMAVARVAAGALLGLIAAIALGRTIARRGDKAIAPRAAGTRGGLGGLGELLDRTTPWIVLGIAIAAVADPAVRAIAWDELPRGVTVALFALVGMPMFLCPAGVAPLAAVVIAHGVSPGAALALLLTGPIGSAATWGALGRARGPAVAIGLGAAVAGGAIALGLAADQILSPSAGLALYEVIALGVGPFEMACLAVFLLMVAVSVLRQGPRGFVGQVLSPHDHGHGPHHGHDHDGHDHGHDGRGRDESAH